jgi:hypothetical protein
MEGRQPCPRMSCAVEGRIVPGYSCGSHCPRANGNWARTDAAQKKLEDQGWRYEPGPNWFLTPDGKIVDWENA